MSIFTHLRTRLRRWFGRPVKESATLIDSITDESEVVHQPKHQKTGLVAYDENLLERARTQWQFGDWASLMKLDRETLQHHPDRDKLALLAAAGHMQQGDIQVARQFTRLAQDWGCSKKLVSQILIAGVHNSLGRAAAMNGDGGRALQHFESAIVIGTPAGEVRLLTQGRMNEQLAQLNLSREKSLKINSEPKEQALSVESSCQPFTFTVLAKLDLGNAWAATEVNTAMIRHHGILTSGNWQYTAFYVDEYTLRLVQINLTTGSIKTSDILGYYELLNNLNSISLGIDRTGHLHISYDHHTTQLRYRRAIVPYDIEAWSDELPLVGVNDFRVSNPTFIVQNNDHPLLLLYRDGVHDKGAVRLKTYNEVAQTWADHNSAILSSAEQESWANTAYFNHPSIGSDGSLHLSFVWNTQTEGEEQRFDNSNIGYARSFDNGLNWVNSHNRSYHLPITSDNVETVYPISPGSHLSRQTSMALDMANRPHIVFYSDDSNGIPQYQHLWFDGKAWRHQIISDRKQEFSLQRASTIQSANISRPEIVIDRDDNIYVIYRDDLSHNQMVATRLSAPDYCYHPDNTQILWEEDLGSAEPVIDRSRWQRNNILTLLLQHNQRSNCNSEHETLSRPVTLVNISFN